MCGIAAGTHRAKVGLSHRGPDGYGEISVDNVILQHWRLSINDPVNGKQPLISEDGNVIAVVNGEFYDIKKLNNHIYRSNSDSEHLIHLYEEYGVNCIKMLEGEFAFILWDRIKKQWFCGRDRFGAKPLVYTESVFSAASEAKCLNNEGLDYEAFIFSQNLQYLPLGRTLFKGVRMLNPGHYLIVKDNIIEEKCYYRQPWSEEGEEADWLELLNNAVKRRTPTIPFTTSISGGIDSCAVTCLSKPTIAHSVQFDGEYDESALAKEAYNTEFLKLNADDMLNVLKKAVWHAEGTCINSHMAAKYLLNKKISKNFKVVLTGEGSDEIFLGYSHLRKDANVCFDANIVNGVHVPTLGMNNKLTKEITKHLGFIPTWICAKLEFGQRMQTLWNEGFDFPKHLLFNSFDVPNKISNAKISANLWSKYCLAGYILKTLDDAQGMAHGVETRLPFLDTKLAEAAMRCNTSLLMRGNIEKTPLREALKHILPANVLNTHKKPFMAPPTNCSVFKDLILGLCDKIPMWNKNKLEFFFKNYTNNTINEGIGMTLASFALFYEQFMD